MYSVRKILSLVLMICMIVGMVPIQGTVVAAENDTILLAKDAQWKYLDNGFDLGTVWRATYDDSTWAEGNAPLGFGDDVSETDPTLPLATTVGFGADQNNKHMTTYFRSSFDLDSLDDFEALEVYIHVDDGAVVYINGTEAFRRGIADGVAVNYNTGAKFGQKEETFVIPVDDLTSLSAGTNVIAAEVHQDDGGSSDLWFEMSIKGLIEMPGEEEVVIPDPNAPRGDVSKVTVTFKGDTTSSKGFTWYTTLASANSDLQVVEKTDNEADFSNGMEFTGEYQISTNSPTELLHKAEATDLQAGTEYYFRVGDKELDLWSGVGTFQTAPNSGAFTFVDLADSQAKSEDEAILSAETFEKAMATVEDADFLAINGDLVDTGSNEQQWDWLFGHAQETLLNTTFVPAAGNHEKQENSFIEHFNLDPAPNSDTETGVYYSYDYSNAHFLVLNNNENSVEYADFTPAQIQWMIEDVEEARAEGDEWIIALMHKGPYTTSNHATDSDIMGENGVRTKVAPIMEELGIDLVLQGHDHIYARSKPIKNGAANQATKITEIMNGESIEYTVSPDGTIYLIPNTAGPKVYYKNSEIDPGYYDLFEVADEHHAAVYGPDPGDPSRPVRSMIQNFEGITIDDNKLTIVSYEIDQNTNNAEPYIIDQFGVLKDESITPPQAKNVILLIGDGMGFEHMEAARGERETLHMDKVNDAVGKMTTHAANADITDSSSAGTAMATGYKIDNNELGRLPDGTSVPTVLELAEDKGLATGVITTTQIAHATPASFASHVFHRNMYNRIAAEMMTQDMEVVMGGGRNNFQNRQTLNAGKTHDGKSIEDPGDSRDLIAEAAANGYTYASTVDELLNVNAANTDKLLGVFHQNNGLVQERSNPPATQPHLNQMTAKGLEVLAKEQDGFFLMVEGGQIDWAAHANDFNNTIGETLAFDDAVKAALDFQANHPDTLVIVTADHETGGLDFNADTKEVSWSSLDHTAAMVKVMAEGPGAEYFSGDMDNTDIARNIVELLNLSQPLVLQQSCSVTGNPTTFTVTSMGLPVADANITVKTGINNTLAVISTDDNGQVSYKFTKDGAYTISATKNGYQNADPITVTTSSPTTGATITGLTVKDGNQQTVTGNLKTGQQYYLTWKAKKNSSGSVSGLSILEVLQDSQPVFLNAANGLTVSGDQDTEFSVLFQPTKKGSMTIKGFFWNNWSGSASWQSLANPAEQSITVE